MFFIVRIFFRTKRRVGVISAKGKKSQGSDFSVLRSIFFCSDLVSNQALLSVRPKSEAKYRKSRCCSRLTEL